ncbi:MAG TPA: tetratricopeptide repeat protein [Gemmataceae bacterium]|jgi:CHAT domain-containing protein/Tfp pilus assembly protein PilF|nr:tetratricopeptide repeat protein [Gemmataceae bacterium]
MAQPATGTKPRLATFTCLAAVALLLAILLPFHVLADPAKPAPPTQEQRQQRLRERDRLWAESHQLRAAGKLPEAVAAARNMLAIEREVLGMAHEEVASSLDYLAGLQAERDDFVAAIEASRGALDIRRALYGEGHWRVTDARLALDDAARLAALTGAQRQQLADADRLNEQQISLYQQGKPAEAINSARRAVEIRGKVLGEKHPDFAVSVNNLAFLYKDMGDYARAEPLYQKALEIAKQALGERHPLYATNLNNLALLYSDLGDYARAEPLLQKALAVRGQALGEKHPDYAASLNNLAGLYASMADYARAEPLYQRAIEINKLALGDKHPTYARSLNNLAWLYWSMGDYLRAEPLLQKALEIRRKALGEKHPDSATSLNSLAALYSSMGNYPQAEPLYQKALEINRLALGERHPDYASSLNNLAALYQDMGEYAKAEPLYQKALEIRKLLLGEKHPAYAASLNNLAALYSSMGDYTRAEPLYQRALKINKQALGEQHPAYASSLNNLAQLYWLMRDYARAEENLRQGLEISRGTLDLAASVQSERQQLVMARGLRGVLDDYLALATQCKKGGEAAYAPVLAWKGAIFARQRRLRLEQQSPELKGDFATLRSVAGRLAALALAAPGPKRQAAYRRQVEELTEQQEQLEAELARRSAAFRDERRLARLSPGQLQKVLPQDTALVDFLEYTQSRPAVEKGQWTSERHLGAFVVRRDAIEQLDLGPVQPVALALRQWNTSMRGHEARKGMREPAAELRRLVWQPLEGRLKGVKTVLISPDGTLARLPFAALPGKASGTYLVEERALAVVPVPQLLPELLATGQDDTSGTPSLLLVGDVDFGAASGPAARGRRARAVFGPLQATREEIVAVRDSFEERYPEGKIRVLRKAQATKGAFRQESGRYRWLHLATHGFFAPAGWPSALAPAPRPAAGSTKAAAPRQDLFGREGMRGFHPGLLSGLALAGANRPARAGEDDGILTALEVAELDLHGVELATLSACETGLGKEAGGEGLLGLQRAFQVAGARSVVASLWSVDDEATRKLMVRFYENLWQKKMSKLEALRQAQLWMLKEGLKRGLVVLDEEERIAKPVRTPPYYWAAFVLSGDWR